MAILRRKPKQPVGVFRVQTAGYSERDTLAVDVRVNKGGAITDGVAFVHEGEGRWVLSYADLEAIYSAASAWRARRR